ncbi:hypothetical protein BHE74_00051435 [Ensete ventricosum]|nr:hypothetical protein BHE74_00051435 [Ensete ventricosum]
MFLLNGSQVTSKGYRHRIYPQPVISYPRPFSYPVCSAVPSKTRNRVAGDPSCSLGDVDAGLWVNLAGCHWAAQRACIPRGPADGGPPAPSTCWALLVRRTSITPSFPIPLFLPLGSTQSTTF